MVEREITVQNVSTYGKLLLGLAHLFSAFFNALLQFVALQKTTKAAAQAR